MSTVYVFGAGASRDVGYPLAAEMGGKLLDFMLKSSDSVTKASGELLVDTFGQSPNIEDLITELQSRTKSLKKSVAQEDQIQRRRLGRCLGWIGVALQQWFREIRNNHASGYAIFAEKIIQKGDTVITFNYDDSLEKELKRVGKWDVSQGYGFPFSFTPHPTDLLVLKLHGSVNWLVSVFGGATGGALIVNPESSLGSRPVMHQADLEFLGYQEVSGYTYASGGAFPCLILPGRTKEFFYDTSMGHEYTEFWNNLWLRASRAVKSCDRIVVCGYSLLQVDQRARDLLLQHPSRNIQIEVVSGGQTKRIASDFIAAGFSHVDGFEGGYFESWCKSKCA